MKKYRFTLTEMLTVIAIIAILAALITAVVIRARASARTTACVSNQGQTIKLVINGMNASDSKITNGNAAGKRYTDWLRDKKLLASLEAVRCPDMSYSSKPGSVSNDTDLAEAYGMVISTAAESKFNFKNNKLFKAGAADVSRSSMLMGGDTLEWKSNASTTLKNAAARAALEFSSNRLAANHNGGVINAFFLDGSVVSLPVDEFKSKSFYYPKADGTGAEKVAAGNIVSE
ncbi:MAG: prepilin-type N-terminal cleavage/methylation domain-containing protein [Lentisphaeria bacterium]|nr:prepilin-type N-terminal cleavage/methylation domain-containing protein [Lentisphaeria bacterium]